MNHTSPDFNMPFQKQHLYLTLLSTICILFSPLRATAFNNTLASVKLLPLHNAAKTHFLSLADGNCDKGSSICPKLNPPFRIKTVVIDAGHGGHDPGCSGAGSHEKDLALAIAKAFAANIEAYFPDIQVILTRDEDVFIPLHERAAIANRAHADLFISIHCNAMPPNNGGTWGSETYVMGLHTAAHNLDVAKRENDAILLEENYEHNYDYDPNSPEGHILLSMFQNAFLEQSILFAERVEHHFESTAQRKSRGVKQAGFVVLKETAMPSVLVETGFLSSRKDEAFLRSAEGQSLVATALLNAFSEYKALLEGETIADAVLSQPTVNVPVDDETMPANVLTYPPSQGIYYPPEYTPPTVDYTTPRVPPADQNTKTVPPPPVYYSATQQQTVVRAESAITPSTSRQGTISTSVPSNERALQPRGKGDTSWAANLGQETGKEEVAGLSFSVQLAASPRPLNTRISPWINSTHLIEVLQEGEMYKYQIRNFSQLDAAGKIRQEVQQNGFPDAFVVAYHNGHRISLTEARALLAQ